MSTQDLVSIVVPVYKVEPYLRRCLDSALAQTHPRIEVIAVDDGSPDRCPAICDEYAAADPRVRVIHQTNGGLSAARNSGIEAARGEWLYFMDSDDWCEPDIIEKCMAATDKADVDMVVFDHFSEGHYYNDGVNEVGMPQGAHSSYDTLTALYQERIDFGSWHFVYRRSLFDDIRFPVGEICEDIAIQFRLIAAARAAYVLHEVGYHYIARETSITWSHAHKLARWEMVQTTRMLEYAREHRPDLAPLAEARAARKAVSYAKGAARWDPVEDLYSLRAFIRGHRLHPVGVTPRTRVGWWILLVSPRLFKPLTNRWDRHRHPDFWE